MAFTTPQMGLRIWNLLTDLYDHEQLADNWAKVNYHDHSPGKGVQIPTEGLADEAVTGPKLAASIDPSPIYENYKLVQRGSGSAVSPLSGGTTYLFSADSLVASAGISGRAMFYLDPADFDVPSRTGRFRIRFNLYTNSTAPAITFTVGLYPVSSVTAGASTAPIPTLGAVTAGSTVAIATPTASSMNSEVSADFDTPPAGHYVIGLAPSGANAANSAFVANVELQVHQV